MKATKAKKPSAKRKADEWKTNPPKRTGQTPTNAVLTAEKVKDAREAFAGGWNLNQLAARFLVTWPTMRDAITGATWAKAGGPIFPDGKRPAGSPRFHTARKK